MTDIADSIRRPWSSEAVSLAILCALGAGFLVLTDVAMRIHAQHWSLFVLLLVLTAIIAVLATRIAASAPSGLTLAIVLGFALAMRLLVVSHGPILSDDIYRYVWDGRVQGAGINPFRYVPADPALAGLRDGAIYPHINRADYAHTIYPPIAQFFFFAVTRIAESITVMRLALIGCEALTVLVLIDLLRRFNKPVTLATAYAWHPLAVWEIGNSGHIDALMVPLVMLGVWLLVRHRRIAAGVMVALGALAKPYALVALPAFWRPWDWRLPAAVIATLVACYLPYLGVGKGVFGFLFTGYLGEEGMRSGDGFLLVHAVRALFGDVPGLLPLYLAIAAGTLGVLALRAGFSADDSPERRTRDIAILLMATLFFLTPQYAWYYLVAVPFIPLGGGAPAWAMTLGAVLLNLLYPDYDTQLLWKGVLNGAFAVAVVAALVLRSPLAARLKGPFSWTR